MTKKLDYKGRASISNVTGRFEKSQTEAIDDGWGSLDADLPPLRTEMIIDTSRSVINYNKSPDIPFDRSINPYRGCEHGCIYCFARPSHTYLGMSAGLDFESRILIKPNAAQVLRQELTKRAYQCAPIALGTNTDPYQPLERDQKIMRQILEVLAECKHPLSIVTKSSLIERDIDLLAKMSEQGLVAVYISITTLDRKLARTLEPRAAAPDRRLATLQILSEAGINTGIMAAPMIPGLNDHELETIISSAQQAGALSAEYILIRLPLEVASLFEEWLRHHYPLKAEHVLNLIKSCREGELYQAGFHDRFRGKGVYADLLNQRYRLICRRLGLHKPIPPLRTDLFRKPEANDRQMRFEFFD